MNTSDGLDPNIDLGRPHNRLPMLARQSPLARAGRVRPRGHGNALVGGGAAAVLGPKAAERVASGRRVVVGMLGPASCPEGLPERRQGREVCADGRARDLDLHPHAGLADDGHEAAEVGWELLEDAMQLVHGVEPHPRCYCAHDAQGEDEEEDAWCESRLVEIGFDMRDIRRRCQ